MRGIFDSKVYFQLVKSINYNPAYICEMVTLIKNNCNQ